MQVVPVFDRYNIQVSRSRMIGLGLSALCAFGFGCGAGIAAASHFILVDIIQASERNLRLAETARSEASEVERQSAMIATRCGIALRSEGNE